MVRKAETEAGGRAAELASANDELRSQLAECTAQAWQVDSTQQLAAAQLQAANTALQAQVEALQAALDAVPVAPVPVPPPVLSGVGGNATAAPAGVGALTAEMHAHREEVATHQRALDESKSRLATMEAALTAMAVEPSHVSYSQRGEGESLAAQLARTEAEMATLEAQHSELKREEATRRQLSQVRRGFREEGLYRIGK
jgi:DNA repair exonuclease SbcCD ATPase subunit